MEPRTETCRGAVAQSVEHPSKGIGSVQFYWLMRHGFESRPRHKVVGKLNPSRAIWRQTTTTTLGLKSADWECRERRQTWHILTWVAWCAAKADWWTAGACPRPRSGPSLPRCPSSSLWSASRFPESWKRLCLVSFEVEQDEAGLDRTWMEKGWRNPRSGRKKLGFKNWRQKVVSRRKREKKLLTSLPS